MLKTNKIKEKKEKVVKSEMDLINSQAKTMLKDMQRLQLTQKESGQKEKRSSVDLWKDTDFFFSVVFQSSAQKYEVLSMLEKKFNLDIEAHGDHEIQIVNGIKFAECFGLKLKPELTVQYPYPNLELLPFSLDGENIDTTL